MRLFKAKQVNTSYPTEPVNYPSDVFVRTEDGTYFIKGKNRFRLYSDRVLDSWGVVPLEGTQASVSLFKEGPTLGFRNGTLIRNVADQKTYLISENKRRHVVSPDVFSYMGFDIDMAMVVSDDEVNIHPEGEVLS